MECVIWHVHGLDIAMLSVGNELYGTSKAVCAALGVSSKTLSVMATRYSSELSSLTTTICSAKEFLKAHRAEFGITRVRDDMRLWNEDDVLTFAFHSRSEGSVEIRKQFRVFLKEHATREVISREEFDQLNEKYEHLVARLDGIQRVSPRKASINLHLIN